MCHVCARPLDDVWASATDIEYGATRERFRYLLCPRCDALSIDPLPADRLAEIYPETYYSFSSGGSGDARYGVVGRVKRWLDSRAYRKALDLVDEPAPRILDVGGGTGDISSGFVEASGNRARATVVDIDDASIEVARSRGLDGFVGRFEDYETDERFDLILMLNLIEHVADPMALLRRARELLKPNGVVWLQTPNFRALDARLFRHRNWVGYHCPRHWVIFSEDGLRRALGDAELEPVRFNRTQGGYFWAGSLLGQRRARRGWDAEGLPEPLIQYRLMPALAAAGAGFDLVTRPVRQVSQVMVMARASG